MMSRAVFLIGFFLILYGVPVQARGAESNPPAIASGDAHVCAVTANQTVVCWGINRYGQLGNGKTADSETPVEVSGLSHVAALAAGDGHTCAAMTTGQVKCWGRNDQAQLGDLSKRSSSRPVLTSVGPATQIAAGRNHTCARLINGAVVCWGDNRTNQTGVQRSSLAKASLPVDVPNVTQAISVAAGDEHSCAVQEGGQLLCWGDDHYGQLGHGVQEHHSFPPRPVPISGKAASPRWRPGSRSPESHRSRGVLVSRTWASRGVGRLAAEWHICGCKHRRSRTRLRSAAGRSWRLDDILSRWL